MSDTATGRMSTSTIVTIVMAFVTVFGSLASLYVRAVAVDAEHHQRLVSLEKSDEQRRHESQRERAEVLGELKLLRKEVQEAMEKLDAKIERAKAPRP